MSSYKVKRKFTQVSNHTGAILQLLHITLKTINFMLVFII